MDQDQKSLPAYVRPTKDDHIKRVAVIMEGELPYMMQLDQNMPLPAIIRTVCENWQLATPEDYSLQFSENKGEKYITEKNRNEIENGDILKLASSPLKTVDEILRKLKVGTAKEKSDAFKQLSTLSSDITFATEFINKSGMDLIINMVESGSYSGEALAYMLKAFVELMDHGIISWDVLEQQFIIMVASCVTGSMQKSSNIDPTALQSSLEILESIVLHSSERHNFVAQEVTPVSLVYHLQSPNADIQKSAIALINAIFLKASLPRRKQIAHDLQCKSIRNVILTSIVGGSTPVGTEMAHQLYVLQTSLFNLLEERMMSPWNGQVQSGMKDLTELRKVAFDSVTESDPPQRKQAQSFSKEWKKLGFENVNQPLEDFKRTPPGMLSLDNMLYFANNHAENFTKIVLESSSRSDQHDCPFSKASIALTKMLCEILAIGELPKEDEQTYYPMFFTHDKPFEEFYCTSIILLNKTWKEMRASSEDFIKVLNVVREQITRALEIQPTTFDQFKNKLSSLTYSEITNIWQQERQNKEEWESQAKPIVELREQIKPEIIEIIKQQRLNYLVQGGLFNKKKPRNEKFWYCRLSSNHKVFHYGDCNEGDQPSIEQLPHKFNVVEIKQLLVGKDCIPLFKKGDKVGIFIFSITLDTTEQPVNFIAPNEHEFNMWTDGINAVLGNAMTSQQAVKDLETLLSMEIKLRLLDIEGITIPEQPPAIPPEPDNYNFTVTA